MILHRNVKITMYQLGHRSRHHYLLRALAGLIILGLVTAGIFAARAIFQSNTVLHQSQAVIRNVPASSTPTQHITQALFTIDLPATWEQKPPSSVVPKPSFTWQGTAGDDSARWMDIYIDTIPANFAANRLLPVEANASGIDVTGTTSDNCLNFTDKSTQPSPTGTVPAKWGGVNFLCDVGNYERDVVAIGSAEGINTVTLTGPSGARHKILLVYTDNSPSPDYTLFASAVKSFQLR